MRKASQVNSSTAIAREKQLAPFIWVILVLCTLAGLRPLIATAARLVLSGTTLAWTMWAVAFLCWIGLLIPNIRYLATHRKTSVGMAPIAVISIAPAAAVTLAYVHAQGPALVALWTVFVVSFALLILFVLGFLKLRSVYAGDRHVDPDAIIIVLGGAIKEGKLSTTLLERLTTASTIWHEGPDRMLVPTGGPVPNDKRCEADYMRDELVCQGVSPASIALERAARNTTENIQNSLTLLEIRGLWHPESSRQLCVLTSDYHLYRALREGHYCGVELVPIPSPTPRKSRLQQWCREILTALVLP